MLFDPSGLASELPDAVSFELALLESLRRYVGFDSAFFAAKGASPSVINLDESKLAVALAANRYADEIAETKRVARARRGVAVDTEVHSEHHVREFDYHRDLIAPVGGRHSLFAFPSLRGVGIGAIMLGRSGSTFSDSDLAFVEQALSRIAVARCSYRETWVGSALPKVPAPTLLEKAATLLGRDRTVARAGGDENVIEVRDRNGFREMVSVEPGRELVWSRAQIRDPALSGWFYIELFHLAAARAKTRTRALFIGCGGGVAVRQFASVYPGIAIDVVECDRRVVELAFELFGLGEIPNVEVSVEDGVAFIARALPSTWDIIVVDAYDGSDLAAGFASRKFFANARRALRPGGAVAFNAIGTLGGESAVQEVERAARAELDDVRLVPVMDQGETYSASALRNVVLVGRREE